MNITVIDVGGTFIKHALMNEQSEILQRGKVPTPQTNRADFLNAIVDICQSYPKSQGIAMSLPGIIDTQNGVCITSGALDYNNGLHIIDELQSNIPVKITVENDAKCAALAEASVGALADVNDGFVLIFGTGVGGAFIKDHKVWRGTHFSAGEVSITITDPDTDSGNEENFFGYKCGVPQLCRYFAQEKNLPVDEVDGVMIFNAVEQNDPVAVDCLDRFTRRIAVMIFNLQMLFDPQRFAIGGGISAQPSFIRSIKKNLNTLYDDCWVQLPNRAEIVACKFQNDANLIGALQNFLGR